MNSLIRCLPLLLCVTLISCESITKARVLLPDIAAEETDYPPLPEAIASFGAAVSGDHLYVYGGHVGTSHQHSTENLAKGFWRLDLGNDSEWEKLADDQRLQGLAVVANGGSIYRIGGMEARNRPKEEEDLHSTASVTRYNPSKNSWENLTPLPDARSSHDAAVLDGKLYVAGGWNLSSEGESWAKTAWVADLSENPLQWKELPPPPFRRRALALATVPGKLYVMGGILEEGGVSKKVDVLDLNSGQWTQAPDLPMPDSIMGFGVSAFGVNGTVYANGGDGVVLKLESDSKEWEHAGYHLNTPRFFHRLLPRGNHELIFVAGASMELGHLDDIERISLLPREHGAEPSDQPEPHHEWTGFRGNGESTTQEPNLPLRWSEEGNVPWSVDLPGYGQSSPVVWGKMVFVTSVSGEYKERLFVHAFDVSTGANLWVKEFEGTQRIKNTKYVSRAAPTPAVDSKNIYALFETGDLFALTHKGDLSWSRHLVSEYGEIKGNHGLASSPVRHEDTLVLLVDHEGPSYLAALDCKTGKNRWKVDRDPRVSWSTPALTFGEDGSSRIVVSSKGIVQEYDLQTGRLLWFVEGLEGNTVPSPTTTMEIVMIGSSEAGSNLAIKRGGSGDVTQSHVAWRSPHALTSFGSPLIHEGRVYAVSKAGVARCLDLATGDLLWQQRIGASCWASPVAAGNHIYFFNKDGLTTVMAASGKEPEVLAENTLAMSNTIHGIAVVPGAFLIRAGNQLTCVGAPGQNPRID